MTKYLPVRGYEGYYEVGEDGSVRSLDRIIHRSDTGKAVFHKGRLIKPTTDKYGYCNVYLSVNRKSKRFRVHRLVAETHLAKIDGKDQVNHKDGNKQNNHKSNLEWATNSENQQHAVDTGLKIVSCGRKAFRLVFTTFVINSENEIINICNGNEELKNAGFDYRLVSAVCLGKRKSHRGCTFIRIEVKD